MRYDLYIHSNVSDGKISRPDLIRLARERKIEYLCFTEHNSFDNIHSIYNTDGLKFINGIEFDVREIFSFHALCYFETYNSSIYSLVEEYRENTNYRTELLLKKIKDVYDINLSVGLLKNYFNNSSFGVTNIE